MIIKLINDFKMFTSIIDYSTKHNPVKYVSAFLGVMKNADTAKSCLELHINDNKFKS